MKTNLPVLSLFAASAAFAISLSAASVTSDKLHERYVAGLATIADTQATTSRMENTLNVIDEGAESQAARVAAMEAQLFGVEQSTETLKRRGQSLEATTRELLERKTRLETHFTALDRVLNNDRSLLAKSTEVVAALGASAEKSGSYLERTIAGQTTAELKQHAANLRDLADQLAQTRQRIGLERTLFEGLQLQLASARAELKTVAGELTTATDRVKQQRATLTELRASLDRDRTSLATQYAAFGSAVEGFRVTQVDVLRRWLLDGPPAGEMPSLSIDDVVEAGLPSTTHKGLSSTTNINPDAFGVAADPMSRPASLEERAAGRSTPPGNEISAEFIQLSRRAQWLLAMLERLESFTEQSLDEADGWTQGAASWRGGLTAMNRSIAELRGTLASLQLEQDMIASTLKLIAKQAGDTTGSVAETAKHIAAQTTQLSSLTAELKRLSAD